MKKYGANKSTEFTRKQISCLYYAAKNEELKIEKWLINRMYDLADYYGYDDNRSVEHSEKYILAILNSFFAKDGETQSLIDEFTNVKFNSFSQKYQAKCNRELVK